ncbi:MAG TPA: redoxin domain-containing protein [Candidatus Sulfotelmatobacter sp.]|nr:redoxin domain-containing protein [Candidatus Sulfotelmatobacter sp.]
MTTHPGPTVGQRAPEFKLKGPGGQPVSLSDFRGRRHVVLAFFPLAFTPVCSHQLPELERSRARLESLGATLLGLSVDSWQTNEVFARQLGIGFPLLSDFKREVSRAYGVLDEERFYSGRAVFLVDRDGQLVYSDVSANPGDMAQIPSVAALIGSLEALPR